MLRDFLVMCRLGAFWARGPGTRLALGLPYELVTHYWTNSGQYALDCRKKALTIKIFHRKAPPRTGYSEIFLCQV